MRVAHEILTQGDKAQTLLLMQNQDFTIYTES